MGMGKLIAVVGNAGVGKTTFTRAFCERFHFVALLEQHAERPFQDKFSSDLRNYALANQIDYLLFRAEQEIQVRRGSAVGVEDGGLDQDYYIFTRLFHKKGFLTDPEYRLCERLYSSLRQLLPVPDLMIRLNAPRQVILERRTVRTRELDIATSDDVTAIEALLEGWMAVNPAPVVAVDASRDDPAFAAALAALEGQLQPFLSDRGTMGS